LSKELVQKTEKFTTEFSPTSGRGKSLDFSGSTVNTFQCDPEDDVQEADDRNGVDFSEGTVRTFACRVGDNPSASKYTIS
jgi:hypothetical protein